MVAFNRFFSSVLVAVLYAGSFVDAAPWPLSSKHATHRLRQIGSRGLEIETFHPKTNFETYGKGVDQPSVASFAKGNNREDVAKAFVAEKLSVDTSTLQYRAGYKTDHAEYAYLKQVHEGLTFANTAGNVAFKDDKVVSFGNSFVDSSKAPSSTPSLSFESIISAAEEALEGTYNGFEPSLEYLVKSDGSIALTHVIQIQNDEAQTWYEAFVDANTGEILSVTDFVADAAYRVLPIQKETLPEGLELIEDPQDDAASPEGWHTGTATSGNNVIAYKGSTTSTTEQSADGLIFDYTYDSSVGPTQGENIDAARVNAFYIINTFHDFTYRYGFTEDAFNFQASNFDNGGRSNDPVRMSVQDSSGTNNANFATPADGQSGQCRMYIWTLTTPNRDGSLENDIPVHEMTHGLTNRMTGGGTGRCLQTNEAGGMGEGWSDAMAEWTELKSDEVPDYVMGQYVTNDAGGIRTVPYSTDHSINPLMYSTAGQLGEVHDIGEVWATTLHGVLATLVGQYGFSPNAKTNPDGAEGNIVYLHLFIDALALQPCNPTMIEARDAWIQADENRYDGANRCLLWTAFADRGFGPNAQDFNDDTSVPEDC